MKHQISTSVSAETARQADLLRDRLGLSLRDLLTLAIDRFYKEETIMGLVTKRDHAWRNGRQVELPELFWSDKYPDQWIAYTSDKRRVIFAANNGWASRETFTDTFTRLQPCDHALEKAAMHLAGCPTMADMFKPVADLSHIDWELVVPDPDAPSIPA